LLAKISVINIAVGVNMQSQRTGRDYLALAGKGIMMGAADAVPGVSGGTIAFNTGIYQELIHSLKQCGPQALSILVKQGFVSAWAHINGNFLLTLFTGVVVSVVTLSRVVVYFLDTYPELLWSFFFGLILAAIWSLVRHIEKWDWSLILSFMIGTAIAYSVTIITPTAIEPRPLYFFLSGMLAICAMILPGISGAFILLLLGMYGPVMLAVKEFQFGILILFACGCVVGLLSFSHVLDWMFTKYKSLTLALLGGFMLGSLNKVWPWKQTLESVIDRHGKEISLVERNVLPQTFESLSGQPAYFVYALGLMLIGVGLVLLMEFMGKSSNKA
jgi:putative membrane protein